MKAVRVLLILAVVFSLVLLSSCSKPNEKLYYGTFTNEKAPAQKTVHTPGAFKDYAKLSDATPVQEGTEKIIKEWVDSEGNTYFQTDATITVGPYKNTVPKAQTLTRINKAGTVLEFMWNGVVEFGPNSYPSKIDSTDTLRYRMYNRVEE
jgi:hypothetical protein